jgi:hypothetical protein
MAEVHPTPSHAGKIGDFLNQSTAGLPNWAWILVVAGGILAAIYIPKLLPGSNTATNNSTGTGLGLAVDPTTGLPYAVEGLVPSGGTTGATTTLSPTTTTSTPTITNSFKTRLFGTGGVEAYDQQFKSIPIRDKPGGNVVSGIGYGVTVTPTGGPVTGPNNISEGNPNGSTIWYPVPGGYISAFDLQIPESSSNTNLVSWPYGVNNG